MIGYHILGDKIILNDLCEHGDIDQCLRWFERFYIRPDANILDVGTRFGSFLLRLKEIGYLNVCGIDINKDFIERGLIAYPQLHGCLQAYDGKNIPFGDAQFDVLTMFDVIEHIPDIETYLEEVVRVLKPGGMFVFQTPNKYTNIPWEIIYLRSLTKWRTFHCSLQSLSSLRKLLLGAKFSKIKIEKNSLSSQYRINLAREKMGPLGPLALHLAGALPLFISPNFWGCAIKPERD